MVYYWGKLLDEENNIIKSVTLSSARYAVGQFEQKLPDICNALDIPTPVVLSTHLRAFSTYSKANFVSDDFVEAVTFKKFEVQLY